jgi:DNA end-binding protein Ku
MPQRSLWRGAISFGLIYVPVEMRTATRDHQLAMHLLDNRDFSPVGYERVNKRTGKSVDWGHIVKGYEYQKGQYVALSEADFKDANLTASETIAISSFTNAADISPLYYQMPYYLVPGKGGDKVYELLAETLRASGKVAVATFVMRGRQHLCIVTAAERTLILVTLRFVDEIISPAQAAGDTKQKPAKLTPAELSMAGKLIAEMTTAWKPKQFHDTYREDLLKRIHEKISKKQTHILTTEAKSGERPKAEVIDLMDALKNSLKLRSKQRKHA